MGRNPSFFCFYHHLFFSSKSCFYEVLSLQFLFFLLLKTFFSEKGVFLTFFKNKSCFYRSKSFFIKLLDFHKTFQFIFIFCMVVSNIYLKRNTSSDKSLKDGNMIKAKFTSNDFFLKQFEISP